MKKVNISLSILLLASSLLSQTPPDTLWTKTFSADGGLQGNTILQTEDNGFIIFGNTVPAYELLSDLFLIKTDSEGNEEWRQIIDVADRDYATSLVKTNDNCYVLSGFTNYTNPNNFEAYIIKIDSLGNQLWIQTYNGVGEYFTTDLILMSDEGFSMIGGSTWQSWLIKTDSEGNEEWRRTYGSNFTLPWLRTVIQTDDEGLLIAGGLINQEEYSDGWLVKTDNLGSIEWEVFFGGPNYDYFSDIQQVENGKFLLAGTSYSIFNETRDGWLIKIDETGDLIWELIYGDQDEETFSKVIQFNNSYYILGSKLYYQPIYDNDILFLNVDQFGNIIWNTTFWDTVSGFQDDYEKDFLILTNNNFIILSDTYSDNSPERVLSLICLEHTVGIEETILTSNYKLSNYPNPFNPTTTIKFSIEPNQQNEPIEIVIYNLKGQKVRTIPVTLSGDEGSGIWNGTDQKGKPVSSGIYFYKLRAGDFQQVKRMILMK